MGGQQGGGSGSNIATKKKKRSLTTSTKRAKKAFVTDPAVKIPHDGPIASHYLASSGEESNSRSSNNAGEEQVD